jgi:putative transcriptional regulator
MAIVKITPDRLAKAIADADWAGIDAQTDEAITAHVASDMDAAPILTETETAAAIVKTVRRRLGLSQAGFAARFHVPIGTLRDWEQGRRRPDSPAIAYLRVIAREPEIVAKALLSA